MFKFDNTYIIDSKTLISCVKALTIHQFNFENVIVNNIQLENIS